MFMLLYIVAGALVFGLVERVYVRHKKSKRFQKREELSLDELFLRYFKNLDVDRENFEEIITEISHVLHVPAGKLRPTDRFDNELRPAHAFDWDNDDLVFLFCQKNNKKTGKRVKGIPDVNTLEEYIKAVHLC